MNQRLITCIEILKYCIKHKVLGAEGCAKFNKPTDFITSCADQVRNSVINNQPNAEQKAFFEVYDQFINSLNSTKKSQSSFFDNIINGYKNSSSSDVPDGYLTPISEESLEDFNSPDVPEEFINPDIDGSIDESFDSRSIGETIRDEDGNIKEYTYRIFIHDQPSLTGVFTRDEMDKIYKMYSHEGGGFTLRDVSREFPELSFRDFKRIIRAFNITKSSAPWAPHIIEEKSEIEIENEVNNYRYKETNVLKRLTNNRNKEVEKRLFQSQEKLDQLRNERDNILDTIELYENHVRSGKSNLPSTTIVASKPFTNAIGKPTVCIFGDTHYGKYFEDPVFGRGYSKEIAHERVMQIAQHIITDYAIRNPSEIILISMGDLVECILEDGMHAGHTYEMDLYKQDQVMFAIDSLMEMLKTIRDNVNCKITVQSIHGNHDRIGKGRDEDKDRTAGQIISAMLKRECKLIDIDFTIPKYNLVKLVKGNLAIFGHHGDSTLSKRKGPELVNLYGFRGCYSVLLQGHWHSFHAEEGTNYISIKVPSVASTDNYILHQLGHNNQPGFILGHEPELGYGFDFKKITLY